MSIAELWRRGQTGWPRSYPIVQFPNAPLLVAFAGLGIAAASDGTPHDIARALYYSGLSVWAATELLSGANGFRRVVGAGGLTWIAFRLI